MYLLQLYTNNNILPFNPTSSVGRIILWTCSNMLDILARELIGGNSLTLKWCTHIKETWMHSIYSVVEIHSYIEPTMNSVVYLYAYTGRILFSINQLFALQLLQMPIFLELNHRNAYHHVSFVFVVCKVDL